jgi:colanic acid/amylovoran biosynthesis glycosyltransferase
VSALKIAYFTNHYPKVSHTFIRREIQAIERQGFTVLRFALRGWDGPLPDQEDQLERERTRYVLRAGPLALIAPTLIVLLRAPRRFLAALMLALRMARHSYRPFPYHLIYLAEACQMLRWLRPSGAAHLHAHFGTNSAEVAMLVASLGGPPYSFTAHGPDEFLYPMGLDTKLHRAAFAVAVSDFGRSQLYLRCPHEDWPRIKVVRCGLEPQYHEGLWTPPTKPSRLVCVGRLCEAKGQLLLIEATAALATRGLDVELVLAGDGSLRAELEQLIAKRDLGRRVRITGWISSSAVRSEILAARALVLPSFAEGLPLVIMEAMALRRPVLSTYVAGIPELVLPGETGWLFPAGSVQALTEAMAECLSAPEGVLRRLGESGRARVLERHSIDIETGKLALLFAGGAATAMTAAQGATQCMA